ncbi:MAG TPA: hypothetical protein VHF26_11625, partial [Trebonia sp.]|nr:hypothetical protein [Trebonia sp.]
SAAPMVRRVYDGLLGAGRAQVLAGGRPETTLPTIAPASQVPSTPPPSRPDPRPLPTRRPGGPDPSATPDAVPTHGPRR